MIDWLEFRAVLDSAQDMDTGRVIAIAPDGSVEWQTMKWMQARGSHDQTMAVRPWGNQLHVSGCPAKFLQGHNCFGADDLRGLLVDTFAKVLHVLGLEATDQELEAVQLGQVPLLRVDVNYSYATGSRQNALAWIRAAEAFGHLAHRGRGMLTGSSVVWGKGSRYHSLKAYCKGQEIEATKHRLPGELRGRGLEQWADDKLRVELQMRARTLRSEGLDQASRWQADTPRRIFVQHLARLNISGESRVKTQDLLEVPQGVRMTYLAWKAGQDVRGLLSKATFYRQRKVLLRFGVDIAVESPDSRSNVVPLRRVVEAVPVGVPEWAVGTDLYYQPRAIA